jgi:hypothetical protein
VSEPSEWVSQQAVTLPVGQQLRIRGQAYHPQGIVAVSVNGASAEIQRDAGSGVVSFTYFLVVDESARAVRVVANAASDTLPAQVFNVNVQLPERPEPPVANPSPTPAANQVPGFVPSFILPGSGQFRTGRSGVGILVLGASAGVAAAGILTTQKEVFCATRTSTCQDSQVLSSKTSRPYLVPAIVAAAALSAVGAWEARKSARALGGGSGAMEPASRLALFPRVSSGRAGAVELEWQLVPF